MPADQSTVQEVNARSFLAVFPIRNKLIKGGKIKCLHQQTLEVQSF